MTVMKGLQLTAPGKYRLRTDLPVPEPGPGEVRLRVAAAGICGTDVHICSGDPSMTGLIAPPVVLGHEFCGHVDALGPGVDAKQLPLGTYVSAEMHEICGECAACKSEAYHASATARIRGINLDGAFAEFVVVWAHNSHVGDATATEMSARGEWNLGELCRQDFARSATYVVGFGTDHGTAAATSYWGGEMERKVVVPSRADSYERVCHDTGLERFLLPLRTPHGSELRGRLAHARLERAIGVIYRPETERASHYFHAVLPDQFDEYVWFDRSEVVEPLTTHELAGAPETYPFGL